MSSGDRKGGDLKGVYFTYTQGLVLSLYSHYTIRLMYNLVYIRWYPVLRGRWVLFESCTQTYTHTCCIHTMLDFLAFKYKINESFYVIPGRCGAFYPQQAEIKHTPFATYTSTHTTNMNTREGKNYEKLSSGFSSNSVSDIQKRIVRTIPLVWFVSSFGFLRTSGSTQAGKWGKNVKETFLEWLNLNECSAGIFTVFSRLNCKKLATKSSIFVNISKSTVFHCAELFANASYFVSELLFVRSSSSGSGGAEQNAIINIPTFSTISPAALLHLSKVDTNYFDASAPRNVTALEGKSAFLSCRIRPSLNRTLNVSTKRKDKSLMISF